MPRWEWLLAIVGASVAFWRQAMSLIGWVKSWVVTTRKCDYTTGLLLLSFLQATMRRSQSRYGAYGSSTVFVRPLDRIYRVLYQVLHGTAQTFWKGWRPLWFSTESVSNAEVNTARRDYHMAFSFLRRTYDWEKLMLSAADWEDQGKQGLDKQCSRFRVQYHYGSGGFGETLRQNETKAYSHDAPTVDSGWNGITRGTRLLRWSFEDVQGFPLVSTLDNLSLRPELQRVVEELTYWHTSQEWYQKHGVPWRRGVIFHGPPGTGKTSLARALAEHLDLPVHVFDLAGMSNQDLKRAWREMLTSSPCMALLEDIDAVFDGRENKIAQDLMGGARLSFDTLLNCIDGIERVDGMLLVVSTNRIDAVDEALKDRPGRIDRIVFFEPLDHDGRVKMALRILEDGATAERMACEYSSDTAARFQERCFQEALRRRFEERLSVVRSDQA